MQRNVFRQSKFENTDLVLVNPFVVDEKGNPIPLSIPDKAEKIDCSIIFKTGRKKCTLLTLNGVPLGEVIMEATRKERISYNRKVIMYTDSFERNIAIATPEELSSILKINIAPSTSTFTSSSSNLFFGQPSSFAIPESKKRKRPESAPKPQPIRLFQPTSPSDFWRDPLALTDIFSLSDYVYKTLLPAPAAVTDTNEVTSTNKRTR
jgi:hypothetical protein